MDVLVVEDDPVAAEFLRAVLAEGGHRVTAAGNGRQALGLLRRAGLAVVLSDWEMPVMDGLELCRAVRQEDFGRYVYVILVTARRGRSQLLEGLSAGADEFMFKPVAPEELVVRLRTAERILSLETRDLAIFAVAKLAESRDPETGAHLERVRCYARMLAVGMAARPHHAAVITPEYVRMFYAATPLHDIGKMSIPDHVLLKPDRLDDREFEIMKTHTSAGAETLEQAIRQYPEAAFLRMARDIAACHHERYDGTGYPAGLAGRDIPLAARIFSVADVYDALVSRRVYKRAFTHDVARSIIVRGAGSQFNPEVVEVLVGLDEELRSLQERMDEDGELPAAPWRAAVA